MSTLRPHWSLDIGHWRALRSLGKGGSLRAALGAFAFALSATTPAQAEDREHVIVDDAWSGATGVHFSGRRTEVHATPEATQGRLRTLYRNTRQLLTSGEQGSVTWRVADHEWSLRTDADGTWELALNQPLALAPGWHAIESEPAASSPAALLVADPANRFGIISDIDDTILVSHVLDKSTLLKNSLAVPPARRDAVPGMAVLYQRLLKQNPAPDTSPVFYVSASPRQLTDNLRTFLSGQGFPRGVLRLKDVSAHGEGTLLGKNQQAYKLRAIETILLAYPQVRFALFGDDGEQDPEIYAALRKKFPAQIQGVWIRRVDPSPDRARFPDQADTAELLSAPR